MKNNDSEEDCIQLNRFEITRREFLKLSAWSTAMVASLPSMAFGLNNNESLSHPSCGYGSRIREYSIIPYVCKTTDRMLSFQFNPDEDPKPQLLSHVSKYSQLGYGHWEFGSPLPIKQRFDIIGGGYKKVKPKKIEKFLNFFTITDIHITDKESPNQLIYMQQEDVKYAGINTSIYSPVMMYTTHVLDAAIQTVNALHEQDSFDFGISLGDVCNSTQYNELRWYIDVIDGKLIVPSSGAHIGQCSIDYQMPYKAVGLNKCIPWYQVLGNHDHFFLGSFPVDTAGLRDTYTADTVWSSGDVLIPVQSNPNKPLFNYHSIYKPPFYYMGLINGGTKYGEIIDYGNVADHKFATGAPKVVPDCNRRSLLREEWIDEFFDTKTDPKGHGFNLVDQSISGFACYSFIPKVDVPIKVIVLDNTQSETDGSTDIHGHGFLDKPRWDWLKAELAAGQEANQLMIIAAHIPICVSSIGSETEWWADESNVEKNAVSLKEFVGTLQDTPNLLMWIAGHRHLNTVKAFISPNPNKPWQGFWQVETSSLRDFPQQFRTFEIYLNSDYTISIVTINVDPAVAPGTPAATSRKYAIAAQQIVKNVLILNNPNCSTVNDIPVPSMDTTRLQSGNLSKSDPHCDPDPLLKTDPTIQFVDLSKQGVPYNASYNAELFKQLSPEMAGILKAQYPLIKHSYPE